MNATVSKVRDALNNHDAEGLAAPFSPDYLSEQPAHPNRGYGGRHTLTSIEPVERDGPGILGSERQLREPTR